MHPSRNLIFILLAALATATSLHAQPGVTAVLPNGREIHPAGNWIPLAPYPFALAVRPDGAQVAVPSIGFPFALNVIDQPDSASPAVRRHAGGRENDPTMEVHAGLAVFAGWIAAVCRDGRLGKDSRLSKAATGRRTGEVSLDGQHRAAKRFGGSFAATLVVSADGKTLYALDQGNWRVVVLDAAQMECIASIATGSYPFGLTLSPDGAKLYVTNTGLFEYTTIPGANENDPLHTGLHFPPFGYPSKAAREGAVVEGKQIAGLGDENSERGSSLWTYDMSDRAHPSLTAKLRLGERITETQGETVGGAAPTGVAATGDAVYVSLAHEDTVAKIERGWNAGARADGAFAIRRCAIPGCEGPVAARSDAERHCGARRPRVRG